MKAYTDLSQSKKLAKILPLESADMFLAIDGTLPVMSNYIKDGLVTADATAIPCWSLAALLDVIPRPSLLHLFNGWRCDTYNEERTSYQLGVISDNPIDACYELILKLHELNLL